MTTLPSAPANTILSQPATHSVRLPVNATGLKERILARASLMNHDAQLRNFTPLRDRLLASGQDPNAKYREIQSERDRLAAEWKNLGATASHLSSPALSGTSASSLPIAAPRLLGGLGLGPWFGYSGSVRMAPAQELENWFVESPYGVDGRIDTLDDGLLPNAGVLFSGDLTAHSKAALWMHTWQYLICFPTPAMQSVLTYSFGVGVQVNVWGGSGSATFLSFLSLGEAANLTNQEITVHNDGYPLVTNLGQAPKETGGSNVTRSFLVGAGDRPAVALVAGVATALSPHSQIMFSPQAGDNFICLAESIDPTTALGPVPTRGLVNFHYQPVPPQAHA